jgi:hypothetical protein
MRVDDEADNFCLSLVAEGGVGAAQGEVRREVQGSRGRAGAGAGAGVRAGAEAGGRRGLRELHWGGRCGLMMKRPGDRVGRIGLMMR